MPVEHSPVDTPLDGKTALSKCNNHERKWAAQITQQGQILQMQVQGILRNKEAGVEDYEKLEKEIRRARRAASSEWEVFRQDFEARKREDALQQLARKWQTEEQKMADAVLDINQARHAKFPRSRSRSISAPSDETTPEASGAEGGAVDGAAGTQQPQGETTAVTQKTAAGARPKAQS